jgi:hypothetical protein
VPTVYTTNVTGKAQLSFSESGQKIGNTIKYNKNASLADLDGDGELDIVITTYTGANKIYFNSTIH